MDATLLSDQRTQNPDTCPLPAACETEELLARAAGADERTRESLLTQVVLRHLPLATGLAMRYRNTGEDPADLVQVARLGLVLAAQRFDVDSGVTFLSFAVPTMLGELRRHVRDHAWVVRPPRRLQELRPVVIRAQDDLTVELTRTPTVIEVAGRVGCAVGDVVEALTLTHAYRPVSLDAPAREEGPSLAETLVVPDRRIDEVEDRLSVGTEVHRLQRGARRVIQLRYYEDCSQQQIGDRIGVSQMQVSRLLNRALGRLRSNLAPIH